MLTGPAFLRENFAQAFSEPLTTARALIKAPHVDDAALITAFLNAEDYALRRSWDWDADEDYDLDDVRSDLLPYLAEDDVETNKFSLYLYDAACTKHLGILLCWGWGGKAQPCISFSFLPSFDDIAYVQDVAAAVMTRMESHGLIYEPPFRLAPVLRAQFAQAAGGGLETPRLLIRPYVPADDDALKPYTGAAGLCGTGYREKEIVALEDNSLYAGIFARADGSLMGETHFWLDADGQPRMSYKILPSLQGRGLASEMHQACMKWTDGFLPLPITRAEIVLDNHASAAVLRKSGFAAAGEVVAEVSGYDGVSLMRMVRPRP